MERIDTPPDNESNEPERVPPPRFLGPREKWHGFIINTGFDARPVSLIDVPIPPVETDEID